MLPAQTGEDPSERDPSTAQNPPNQGQGSTPSGAGPRLRLAGNPDQELEQLRQSKLAETPRIILPYPYVAGDTLTPETRDRIRQDGTLGLQWIGKHLSTNGLRSFGLENELVIVDPHGQPAFGVGHAVHESLKDAERGAGTRAGGELLSNQLEHRSVYTKDVRGTSMFNVDLKVRADQVEFRSALPPGHQLFGCGVLVTVADDDLKQGNVTPNKRYYALGAELQKIALESQWSFERVVEGEDGLTTFSVGNADSRDLTRLIALESPEGKVLIAPASFFLEGLMTSLQVHVGVADQAEYVGYHRVSDLVSPILVAVSAGSPIVLGKQMPFKESRTGFLWDASTHPNRNGYISLNENGEVVKNHTWLRDPLEQLAIAQTFPLLRPDTGGKTSTLGKQLGALDDPELELCVRTCVENSKTWWPHTRTTLGFETVEGESGQQSLSVVLRFENRVMSAGPTLSDQSANAMFCYALIYGMRQSLVDRGIPIDGTPEELAEQLPLEDAVRNMDQASAYGLDGQARWIGGDRFSDQGDTFCDLIRDQLLEVYDEGVELLGIDKADAQRCRAVIERRISFRWDDVLSESDPQYERFRGRIGATPADILQFIDDDLERERESVKVRWRAEPGYADSSDAQLDRLFDTWKTETLVQHQIDAWSRDSGGSYDFVSWFKNRYLTERRVQEPELLDIDQLELDSLLARMRETEVREDFGTQEQ